MLYRVYDRVLQKWVKDNIYMTPNGELYKIKSSFFGWSKVPLALDDARYIYNRAINLYDKNQELVYEDDYIKAQVDKDKTVIGIVGYAHEISSYVIFCIDTGEYYTLGSEVCEFIEVVGNTLEGFKEEFQDGQQSLQEQEA